MNDAEFKKKLKKKFYKAARHMIKQGRPATENGTGCVYRAQDGCMCGVGVLIPNDQYHIKMEGLTTTHILNLDSIVMGEELRGRQRSGFLRVMKSLQQIHDFVPVSEWERELNKLELSLIGTPGKDK